MQESDIFYYDDRPLITPQSKSDRQQQLQELYDRADTPQLKFLVMGEKQRVKERHEIASNQFV